MPHQYQQNGEQTDRHLKPEENHVIEHRFTWINHWDDNHRKNWIAKRISPKYSSGKN